MRVFRSPLALAQGGMTESEAFHEMLASMSYGGGDLDLSLRGSEAGRWNYAT